MSKNKINFVSLGCSKNTVDSETIAGRLVSMGFEVAFDSKDDDFDFVLINTCGFIEKAKQESIDVILSFASYRKETHRNFEIIVFGCLAQRYRQELEKAIPEVDRFFGLMNDNDILSYISSKSKTNERDSRRVLSTPKHYAYLKISEGCDRRCSFCAIPLIKGKHVSVPIEQIVAQAKELVAQGVKELILIAQDTSYYGIDLYGQRQLPMLLQELCKTDVHWIRLQYSYPNQFPLEVLDLMNTEKKLCHYLDMPLQHISDKILSSMNRNISSKEVNSLIELIREKVPDIALRTTLIVGYPGECKTDFEQLLAFVNRTNFDRMGAFTYSKEEGTKAACLRNSVPEKEKQRRLDELTFAQQEISYKLNQNKIGKVFETIVDRVEGDYFVGRTQYDSPEVDNEVLIPKKDSENIIVGNFYNVRVESAQDFDLYGRIVK